MDQGAIAIKGYSAVPKASPSNSLVSYPGHFWVGWWQGVIPFCRDAANVLYSPNWQSKNFGCNISSLKLKWRSCRYCYIDALHGRYLDIWRKSLMVITQVCWEQYWTSPGCNSLQSSSYMITYHPSWKLSKLDKPGMQDTSGEVRMNS